MQVNWTACGSHSVADNPLYFTILVDGATEIGSYGLEIHTTPTVNKTVDVSLSHQTAALTAGSHTVKLQWAVDTATATVFCGTQTACAFSSHEIR